MGTPLEKVTGIGPASAKLLMESGISSAEDLAARQVEEIAAVRGFSSIRAAQVLAAARELFVLKPVDPEPEPVAIPEVELDTPQEVTEEKVKKAKEKTKEKTKNKKSKDKKVKKKDSKGKKKEPKASKKDKKKTDKKKSKKGKK